MSEKARWRIRILLGGCAALILFFLLAALAGTFTAGSPLIPVSAAARSYFGSRALALALQMAAVFALGGAVGVSTLPFADEGGSLVRRSLTHYAVTGSLVLLAGWTLRLTPQGGWLLLLALYTTLYVLIWLGRWIGWYMEIVQIRQCLGLAPGPSLGKWRETLPYLPLLLLICDGLPLALRWVDLTFIVDVPVFSGVLLPFLILPVVGFCSGLSLGKRNGVCPLYPLAAAALYLPMVFLLYNSSALFHCFMVAVPALAGNLAGAVHRRRKAAKEDEP